MNDKGAILDVFLAEYNTLKAEQSARIGFRDNLLYVTLGVFGATVSFAVSDPSHTYGIPGDSLGFPLSSVGLM